MTDMTNVADGTDTNDYYYREPRASGSFIITAVVWAILSLVLLLLGISDINPCPPLTSSALDNPSFWMLLFGATNLALVLVILMVASCFRQWEECVRGLVLLILGLDQCLEVTGWISFGLAWQTTCPTVSSTLILVSALAAPILLLLLVWIILACGDHCPTNLGCGFDCVCDCDCAGEQWGGEEFCLAACALVTTVVMLGMGIWCLIRGSLVLGFVLIGIWLLGFCSAACNRQSSRT